MISPLISVIIPIYNAEDFLTSCLDSILEQSFKDFELVLINDGSTDSSEMIINEYASKYSFIHYYYQKNAGVSAARNLGIKKANGKYICFVDSDDTINVNYLEEFVKIVSNSEIEPQLIIQGNPYFSYPTNNYQEIYSTDSNKVIFEELNLILNGFLHSKMFLKATILDNALELNEKIHFCEDLLFLLEYLKLIEQIHFIPNSFYNYAIHENSLTNRINSFDSELETLKCFNSLMRNFELTSYQQYPIVNQYSFIFLYRTFFALYRENKNAKLRLNKFNMIIDNLTPAMSVKSLSDKVKYLYQLFFNKQYYLFDYSFALYLKLKSVSNTIK